MLRLFFRLQQAIPMTRSKSSKLILKLETFGNLRWNDFFAVCFDLPLISRIIKRRNYLFFVAIWMMSSLVSKAGIFCFKPWSLVDFSLFQMKIWIQFWLPTKSNFIIRNIRFRKKVVLIEESAIFLYLIKYHTRCVQTSSHCWISLRWM